MNVTYEEGIKQDSNLLTAAQDATEELEEVVGRAAPRVDVEWKLTHDELRRPMLELKVTDGAEQATMSFEPQELTRSPRRGARLYRIWGDVLEARSHRLLRDLLGPDSN